MGKKRDSDRPIKHPSFAWHKPLLHWYDHNRRDLPWRQTDDPYAIWVSEIMLQQTRVETVIPYYERFLGVFPTVTDLAAADIDRVLKCWEGLGYYRRAQNLHKAAQMVVSHYDGKIPDTFDDLKKLPGLGDYTAAAVASIAFSAPVPVVDGNVARVFARVWTMDDDSRQPAFRKKLFSKLLPLIQRSDPSRFNQAIMELGALVCTPKKPDCRSCPMAKSCMALAHDRTTELPIRSKQKTVPHIEIAVGVIWYRNRLLIQRRANDAMLGGLWEFPGGKREENETLEECAMREIKEETGLVVSLQNKYRPICHTYSHFRITLTAFDCQASSKKVTSSQDLPIHWIDPAMFTDYPFPAANKRLIEQIEARHG